MSTELILLITYVAGLLPAYFLEKKFNNWIAKNPGWPEAPKINFWFFSWLIFLAILITMLIVFIVEPNQKRNC